MCQLGGGDDDGGAWKPGVWSSGKTTRGVGGAPPPSALGPPPAQHVSASALSALLTLRLACLRSLALCLVRSVKNTEVHSAPSRRHARIARWLQAGPSAVLASSPWACPSSSGRPPETGSARCRGLLLGRRARAAPRDSRVPVSTHGCFRALACRCCPSGLNRCLLGNGGSEGGHPQNHNVAILKCASQMPLGKLAAVLSHLRAV